MTMRFSTREYQSDQSSANLLDGFLVLFTSMDKPPNRS